MYKLLLLLLAASAVCVSQSIPVPHIGHAPKRYVCYTAGAPVAVDGTLNEAAWARAAWTDEFVDIEGAVKPHPRFRTRAKMLWDSTYLYIAAEVQEPDIWANMKKRDDIIFFDNDFEIFIDPDGDSHQYCEFEMNALNTVWELLLVQPYRDIENAAKNGWDIKGLKTGVKVYGSLNKPGARDSMWTVEVAFPWEGFKELTSAPAPPKDKDQWRINFSRVEWKTEVKNGKYVKQINPATQKSYPEDNWVWSPQGVVNMHYPEMWGLVQFSTTSVGGAPAAFVEKAEEDAKWLLRQVYYAQWKYFEANKSFTNDVQRLGITVRPVPGYAAVPVIECTTTQFTASLASADRSTIVSIRNDGLTRITKTGN